MKKPLLFSFNPFALRSVRSTRLEGHTTMLRDGAKNAPPQHERKILSLTELNFPILLAIIFLDSFSYFIVIPILLELFYAGKNGLLPIATSNTTRDILIGVTLSLPQLIALMLAPLIGAWSDQYGRKKTLLFCLGCMGLGFLLPIFGILKQSLALIWLGRIANGVGATSQPVAQATIADTTSGKTKSRRLGHIAFVMTLAIVLGPLVGGYLSKDYLSHYESIVLPYMAAFIFTTLTFFATLFYFTETTINRDMHSVHATTTGRLTGINQLSVQYGLTGLFISFFCLEFSWSQYYQSIFFYLKHVFAYSPQMISYFNTYMGLMMAGGLIIVYPALVKRVAIITILSYSIFLLFLSLCVDVILPLPTVIWCTSAIIAICTGMAYTSLVNTISNQLPTAIQGKAMGYASTLLYLAWTLTGFLAGWLFHLNAHAPFYVAGLALFFPIYFMCHARIKRHTLNMVSGV